MARRGRWTSRVALLKRVLGLPARDLDRELQVRRLYAQRLTPHGWGEDALDRWLDTLLSVSHEAQAEMTVSFQGGRGSWSQESLEATLPGVRVGPCETFEAAWRQATEGTCVAAWLPVTNSTTGPITEVAPITAEAEAWLEVAYPIRHALLGAPGLDLDRVRRVEAHPRALEQCRRTLALAVPRAELVGTVDGAWSSTRLQEGTAALGSARLARPGLRVLRPDMADDATNSTTFRLLVPRLAY